MMKINLNSKNSMKTEEANEVWTDLAVLVNLGWTISVEQSY